jgi:hypothetical protein
MSDPFLDLVPQYKYKTTYTVSGGNCDRPVPDWERDPLVSRTQHPPPPPNESSLIPQILPANYTLSGFLTYRPPHVVACTFEHKSALVCEGCGSGSRPRFVWIRIILGSWILIRLKSWNRNEIKFKIQKL